MKANLNEILCSIQGEGSLVGSKQVFIRLAGCNLRCSYCDTTDTFKDNKTCQVYPEIGKDHPVQFINNPVPFNKASEIIQGFNAPWLSFTGGEPLLNADYILKIIKQLQNSKQKFILETNGTLPNELAQIIDYLDYISMDMKLPSVVGTDYFK